MTTPPPIKSQKSLSKDKNKNIIQSTVKAPKNDFRFAPKPVTEDMLK